MFWLGLLLPVCFVAGYTGATIPTQWVALSIILPFSLWKQPSGPRSFHWLWIMLLAYATLALAWASNIHATVLGLWYLAIWYLSFRLGASLPDLTRLWKGLAIGLSISSAVAVAQALDYSPVEATLSAPSGLLYNPTLQGASIALVLIALIERKLWLYTPMLWIGLILSESRGAFAILAVALIARYIHWLAAVALIAVAAIYSVLWLDPSDSQRLMIWGIAFKGITFFGYGPGSFNDVYVARHGEIIHLGFTHNDYLQLWFEYGIAAIAIYWLFFQAIHRRSAPDWSVAVAIVALAGFYFPLYAPLTAFLGFLVAGHLLRSYDPVRDFSIGFGFGLVSRCANFGSAVGQFWRLLVSLESGA